MPLKDYVSEPYMGLIARTEPQGRRALFGSEVEHSSAVSIRISQGSISRRHSRDWYFPNEEFIEVTLSHDQWATFVSTGMGHEVPCTIQHIQGKAVEQPAVRKVLPKFKEEVFEALQGALEKLDALSKTRLTKAQQTEVQLIRQDIESNLPYVVRSAQEHVEEFTQKAKTEVESFMQQRIAAAGMKALQSEAPILIPDSFEEEDQQ